MELDQLLTLYQAVSATASSTHRTWWHLMIGFLLAQGLLLVSMAFLSFPGGQWPAEAANGAVVACGVIVSLAWIGALLRVRQERTHWQGILRGMEAEFAGAEAYRSLFRLFGGEEISVQVTTRKCDQWFPERMALGRLARILPLIPLSVLPMSFLSFWVIAALGVWIGL